MGNLPLLAGADPAVKGSSEAARQDTCAEIDPGTSSVSSSEYLGPLEPSDTSMRPACSSSVLSPEFAPPTRLLPPTSEAATMHEANFHTIDLSESVLGPAEPAINHVDSQMHDPARLDSHECVNAHRSTNNARPEPFMMTLGSTNQSPSFYEQVTRYLPSFSTASTSRKVVLNVEKPTSTSPHHLDSKDGVFYNLSAKPDATSLSMPMTSSTNYALDEYPPPSDEPPRPFESKVRGGEVLPEYQDVGALRPPSYNLDEPQTLYLYEHLEDVELHGLPLGSRAALLMTALIAYILPFFGLMMGMFMGTNYATRCGGFIGVGLALLWAVGGALRPDDPSLPVNWPSPNVGRSGPQHGHVGHPLVMEQNVAVFFSLSAVLMIFGALLVYFRMRRRARALLEELSTNAVLETSVSSV